MSDQDLVWLLWLADPRWPRGGGRRGCTSQVGGRGQRQHLCREMTDTAEQLGLGATRPGLDSQLSYSVAMTSVSSSVKWDTHPRCREAEMTGER